MLCGGAAVLEAHPELEGGSVPARARHVPTLLEAVGAQGYAAFHSVAPLVGFLALIQAPRGRTVVLEAQEPPFPGRSS